MAVVLNVCSTGRTATDIVYSDFLNTWAKDGFLSITVHILYTGREGSAKAFAAEMMSSGLVDKIRAEAGNERYAYFFPMEDEESVLLIDRWKNQEAIDKHHKSEMMTQIAALRKKYGLKMRVERYTDLA